MKGFLRRKAGRVISAAISVAMIISAMGISAGAATTTTEYSKINVGDSIGAYSQISSNGFNVYQCVATRSKITRTSAGGGTFSIVSNGTDENFALSQSAFAEGSAWLDGDASTIGYIGLERCYYIDLGEANFKNEGTNIGTINNTAVLKYPDISFDGLVSICAEMTSDEHAAYIQFYRDLEEAEDKTLYTYDKDAAVRDYRYSADNITIDETKAISDKVQIQGGVEVSVDTTSGTGDLYMVVRKVSGTWAGNFDYLDMTYVN